MAKLWITSRRYSSWSLRGWLAARQSGVPIEIGFVDIYAADWPERRATEPFASAAGKVPVLVDGEAVIWNALGIVEWLDRASGGTRFWPRDGLARAFAWSAAAEMQASFAALRRHCPMNVMRRYPGWALDPEARPDVERVASLWQQGLDRFGGPWLAGADWGAVDLMYAPVASRFTTYDVALPPDAEAYRARSMGHPLVAEWVADAATETIRNPA
ncbi:MAG: glutathione S-transferase, partial [Sphingomonadaceae bacterium]